MIRKTGTEVPRVVGLFNIVHIHYPGASRVFHDTTLTIYKSLCVSVTERIFGGLESLSTVITRDLSSYFLK